MTTTQKAPETGNIVLAVIRRKARTVERIEKELDAAKAARDEAILAATAAGIGSRTIAGAACLSNSGVRKIIGADTS